MGEFLDNETGLKMVSKFIKTELCVTMFIQGSNISMHFHIDGDGEVFSSDHVSDKRYPVKWSFK